MEGKCRLCGGRLSGGRCVFCGLDNSVYTRERLKEKKQDTSGLQKSREAGGNTAEKTSGRKYRAPDAGESAPGNKRNFPKTQTGWGKRTDQRQKKGSAGGILAVIIAVVTIASAAGPTIIDIIAETADIWHEDAGAVPVTGENNPYEYATREIPETGSDYEVVLGSGVYRVGVHIPEGVYRIELVEGAGAVQTEDYQNLIFESEFFGENEAYNERKEKEGLRLYNGGTLNVGAGVELKFSTANAQPYTQPVTENPSDREIVLESGSYTAGGDTVDEGIYDIFLEAAEGYVSSDIELSYLNNVSAYYWLENGSSATDGELLGNLMKNVVIPAGTSLDIEGDPVRLKPSEGYYDADFENYPYEI